MGVGVLASFAFELGALMLSGTHSGAFQRTRSLDISVLI